LFFLDEEIKILDEIFDYFLSIRQTFIILCVIKKKNMIIQ